MFEQLMEIIKMHSTETIINNPAVPNEHNEAVMQEAGNSCYFNAATNAGASGQVKDVMSIFKTAPDKVGDHPASNRYRVISWIDHGKMAWNSQQAGGIAGSLLPSVLGGLVKRPMTLPTAASTFRISSTNSAIIRPAGWTLRHVLQIFRRIGQRRRWRCGFQRHPSSMFTGGGNASSAGGGPMDKLKGMLGS